MKPFNNLSTEELKANYLLYKEAKIEINEEPLSYEDWLILEEDCYNDC